MANNENYNKELQKSFNEAATTLVANGTTQFGDAFYTQVYVQMFHEFPNVCTIEGDGFYLNPKASEFMKFDSEDDEEYSEEEDTEVYTFENVEIQKTFVNLVDKFKGSAYIIRNDDYPVIIGDRFIIYWSSFIRCINVLQSSDILIEEIKECIVDKKNDKDNRWFTYITTTSQGFSETPMRIKNQEIDIASNYNDDLPHDVIVDFLKSNKSGLILLHGVPGSGKTTYIRSLMHEIKGRNFIVLDSSVFAYITDASFINLLLENKNSVIILEDCETMLADRMTNYNTQLATLLNISDGLLGDELNFKFICTFNSEIDKLDKAVLRKGRMKLRYEFNKLTADKTKALANKLGKDIPDGESLALADIFNYGEDNGGDSKKENKIGFGKKS